MSNDPLLIGITGGIGAGKSIVCRVFNAIGTPSYDADSRAKWLMNNDQSLRQQIISSFGEESYTEDGKLNRAYLAETVFNDEQQLKQMNALVHPAVGADFKVWVKEHRNFPYLIKEAALLFESGSFKQLDKVINVYAPEGLRIKRVLLRDQHRSKKDVQAIISNQFPEKQKISLADYKITNDDQQLVIPQVLALHKQFLA